MCKILSDRLKSCTFISIIKAMPKLGATAQKALLLLLGGVALGLSGSPRRYARALKGISWEWAGIKPKSIIRCD